MSKESRSEPKFATKTDLNIMMNMIKVALDNLPKDTVNPGNRAIVDLKFFIQKLYNQGKESELS